MRHHQRTLPGMAGTRRITKAETFAEVQHTMLALLRRRGHITADALRERLDIPPAGLPAIGRAIADLARQGLIVPVDFALSERPKAHARPLRIWRLTGTKRKSPTSKQG